MSSAWHDTRLPVWDDKIGTVGPTQTSALRVDDVAMTSAALRSSAQPTAQGSPAARRLRLLPREHDVAASAAEAWAPDETARLQAPAAAEAPVLILGEDPIVRAHLRHELTELMPDACFQESGTFWEALVLAPSSRLVVLSGEVGELSAEELMHALAHRHPDLPVVSLEPAASPA
jgi:hypothetical protein